MSILDEIRADQGKPTQCQFCIWLRTQSKSDQAEWQAALEDRTITTSSIQRAVARRMPDGQKTPTIDTHRQKGHKV